MKNNRGAISIEMIITVIVMILLAGICIFMLTGENGLFVPKDNENNAITNEINNNVQEPNTNNSENALTVPVE